MAYRNLKAEFVKHGIVQRQVAQFLGMSPNNFSLKLAEKVPFTVEEIKRVRNEFVPDATLDYLLESDGDVPTEREKELASLDVLEGILDDVEASPVLYESLAGMRSEVQSGESETS